MSRNFYLHFLLAVVVGNETAVSVYFTSLAWVHRAVVGSLGNVDSGTIWLPPTFNRSEALDVDLARARHPLDSAGVADKNLVFVKLRDGFDDISCNILRTPTWISSFLYPITAPFLKTLEALPTTGQGTS